MTPGRCRTCADPRRAQIDAELVQPGGSVRSAAERWGIPKSSLLRHKEKHIPESLAKAQEAKAVAEGSTLCERIEKAERVVLAAVRMALEDRDPKALVSAARELREIASLLAEVKGELERRGGTTVNVLNVALDSETELRMLTAALASRGLRLVPAAASRVIEATASEQEGIRKGEQ